MYKRQAHTYQIRSRNAEGYSEWSNELQVTTLEDPWRNVPEQSIKWEYGDQWGKIAHANDKNFNTMFHSTGDATGKMCIRDRYQKDNDEAKQIVKYLKSRINT